MATSDLDDHEETVLQMQIDGLKPFEIADALGLRLRDVWCITNLGIAKIRSNPMFKTMEKDYAS